MPAPGAATTFVARSGQVPVTAAGLATLRLADADVYARVDQAAAALSAAVAQTLTAAGVPHRLQAAGSLFSIFWGSDRMVTDYATAQQQHTAQSNND